MSDIIFRLIKILDIGYIAIIYVLLGLLLAKMFDYLYGTFDKKKERTKSFLRKTLEICGMMWIYGALIYVVRNTVEFIPSPFHGIHGFSHLRVKELTDAPVFIFIFFYFQEFLKNKLNDYYTITMSSF